MADLVGEVCGVGLAVLDARPVSADGPLHPKRDLPCRSTV
jgi:hypothetical protein